MNQKRGVRWNARKAFLRPIMHRKNLTIVTGALIDRLVFDGKQCPRGVVVYQGVKCFLDGVPAELNAPLPDEQVEE